MNIKSLHLKALRAPKFLPVSRVPIHRIPLRGVPLGHGWTREQLSGIGPLTTQMLKTRHISQLVGQAVFHFGGVSLFGHVMDAQDGVTELED